MLKQLFVLLPVVVSGVSCRTTPEKRLNNGVGRTPILGWNSWVSPSPSKTLHKVLGLELISTLQNQGGCNAAAASVVMNTANALVSLGLKDLGYLYVNIDDCWSARQRNSTGHLVADMQKFPKGMDGLARDVHALGLKLGLYGDAGTQTCSGFPGSYGNEQKDADTLAAWGIDYWKFDNCNTNVYTNRGMKSPQYYPIMRDALQRTGKPILFSMCQWGQDNVWEWGANVGNSWRISGDITNNWESVASIAAQGATLSQYAAPGGFNDLDMMELGNGGLSDAEERAHFGLWAIMKSPIILGTDVTRLKSSTLSIIKNQGVLAIHQDSLGKAATTFTPKGKSGPQRGKLYKYWAGPLSDGVVIGLVAADGAETLTVNFDDVPGLGSGNFSWTELYSGQTGSGMSVSRSLGRHDMAVFKVTRA